jgi:predicted thioesterase
VGPGEGSGLSLESAREGDRMVGTGTHERRVIDTAAFTGGAG